MKFREEIRSCFGKISTDRILIAEFDQIDITKITQGVIVIFATWSGSSFVSFGLLCDALAQPPAAKFLIYVADTDTIDREAFALKFGKRLHGNGETIWIKKGKVLHLDNGYTNKENQILQHKEVIQKRIASLNSLAGHESI